MEKELTPAQLEAMISLLDDEDREVIEHVENRILGMDESIVPILEDAWASSFDPVLQERIENILHSFQFNILKNRLAEWQESEQDDLLKGLWIIATYQYPDLTYEELQVQIEQCYFDAWVSFQNVEHPIDQVRLLNSVFFNKLKFKPNVKNFHSVNNSMINQVLESKKGNPISLCVVFMLIAQKLKMPVYGVNLPNLFVLIYQTEQFTFYINVFNKGVVFSKQDIDNYLERLKLEKKDKYYEPCSNLDIIKRMLFNLIQSFEYAAQGEKIPDIIEMLEILGEKIERR